jgi:putative hydrolase of the HAD superfamily
MNSAIKQIVIAAFAKLGITNQEYAFEIADNYSKKRLENLELFPGAKETLEQLSKNKIKLALITNGDPYTQRYKIKKFGLEKYFEQIIIEGEIGYGKPDMQIYHHALTSLNQTPKDVWMVGDNLEWDVEAPQKLGVFSIWVDFKMQGLLPQSLVIPDRIINSIYELLKSDMLS